MTTVALPDTSTYTTVELASCLVMPPAVPTDHRFDFHPLRIRRAVCIGALNPENWSSTSTLTSASVSVLTSPQLHTRKVDPARQGALGSRFTSPHTVRSSLDHPLECSARFGSVFDCARWEYRRLTAHFIKCRQIPSPQVGRSHNPLVAGSSPARPTLKAAPIRV